MGPKCELGATYSRTYRTRRDPSRLPVQHTSTATLAVAVLAFLAFREQAHEVEILQNQAQRDAEQRWRGQAAQALDLYQRKGNLPGTRESLRYLNRYARM